MYNYFKNLLRIISLFSLIFTKTDDSEKLTCDAQWDTMLIVGIGKLLKVPIISEKNNLESLRNFAANGFFF